MLVNVDFVFSILYFLCTFGRTTVGRGYDVWMAFLQVLDFQNLGPYTRMESLAFWLEK